MLQRTLPAGFIGPCLPTKTDKLQSDSQWLHEIKHDGFRIIARKNGAQVRLYSRPGNDLTHRFPLIAETLARLRSRSCIIDGEAVACDDNAVASFDLVRHQRANESIFLYAFDLIDLNGDDLRREPPQQDFQQRAQRQHSTGAQVFQVDLLDRHLHVTETFPSPWCSQVVVKVIELESIRSSVCRTGAVQTCHPQK